MLFRWLILVTLFSTKSFAQEIIIRPKNAFYIEGCGAGLIGSLNYERLLYQRANFFMSGRIGAGFGISEPSGVTLPHSFFINLGDRRGYLEIGLTGVYARIYHEELYPISTNPVAGHAGRYIKGYNGYMLSPSIGYKHFAKKKIYFKLFINPMVEVAGDAIGFEDKVNLWMGASIGYAF